MLDNETKRRIDTARDILVGKVPDPKSQVEQITIALIYKFMDDMDAEAEELGGQRTFFSGDFAKYSWVKLMAPGMGGFEVLNLYAEAITKMDENAGIPLLFREIFKNAYLPYRDPETLKSFLKVINDFTYDHSERLGDAFEYLLSVLGSQGDAGQFRTPRHIIEFMVKVIDPQKQESILDPACGTAGFLISAYKHIMEANAVDGRPGATLTPDERNRLLNNIIGYDISPDMVRLSLVNLYLHGFSDPHIYEYDTLTSDDRWIEYYDIIMANPPFMSPKGGIRPHKRFSVQSKRSEVLFVDYIAEHLRTNGRAAVIVPEGIIFQSSNAYKQLRKMLVDDYLVGVISLPSGVFNPYSGVKTSILWLDKALAKQTDQIVFVKIENDGFGLGARRREIKRNDLPAALAAIIAYKASIVDGSYFDAEKHDTLTLVKKEVIAKNGDYNLGGERYGQFLAKASQYEFRKLGEICENLDRKRVPISKEDRKPGPFPYYGASGIVDHVDDYLFDEDLLLLSEDGANLLARVTPIAFSVSGKIWVNNHAHVLKFQNFATQKYVEYCLNSMDVSPYVTGSAQPKLNQKALNSIQVPLPPLAAQEEIVAEIEGYQRIIDGARQVVENYRPLIPIDPEWPLVELGSVSKIIMGQSPPGDSYNDFGEGVPLINGPVEFGPLPFSQTLKRKFTTKPTKLCQQGDLILCVRGSTTGRMNIAGFDACIGRGVAAIRANGFQGWINHIINNNRDRIYELGSGSTFPNVTASTLFEFQIPFPNLTTQEQIVAEIEQEQTLVAANRQLILSFEQKIKDLIARVWGES